VEIPFPRLTTRNESTKIQLCVGWSSIDCADRVVDGFAAEFYSFMVDSGNRKGIGNVGEDRSDSRGNPVANDGRFSPIWKIGYGWQNGRLSFGKVKS